MKFKIILLLVVLCTGCVRVDTGDVIPTLGEQIMDLAKARESGVISDEEFRSMKRRLFASLL